MAVHDIQKKEWRLLEDTVSGIGKIVDRTSKKQMNFRDLRSGIKQNVSTTQRYTSQHSI